MKKATEQNAVIRAQRLLPESPFGYIPPDEQQIQVTPTSSIQNVEVGSKRVRIRLRASRKLLPVSPCRAAMYANGYARSHPAIF